ncbi:MAG: septation protein SepH [Candidatus Nanopelagicaceae bacterium]|nr:septation protein SepH [Candidatus Nanopelagicaceae bacterium]
MTELRLNGKTPDGAYISLTDNDGAEYTLRISDTLRATVNQPRLAAVSNVEGAPLTVKEIQARLRSGEPIESLAREAQWTVEKVERFAGPIVQERAYIIGLAHSVLMRKESGRENLNFAEVVASRLAPRQVDMDAAEWSAWRLEDRSWVIRLNYPNRDGFASADWTFDLSRHTLAPLDDDARWIIGDESTSRERPPVDHGLIYGNHPSATRGSQNRPLETRDGPRLVSIRETPDEESARDGITSRAVVPSWDEIMFGSRKNDEDSEE